MWFPILFTVFQLQDKISSYFRTKLNLTFSRIRTEPNPNSHGTRTEPDPNYDGSFLSLSITISQIEQVYLCIFVKGNPKPNRNSMLDIIGSKYR